MPVQCFGAVLHNHSQAARVRAAKRRALEQTREEKLYKFSSVGKAPISAAYSHACFASYCSFISASATAQVATW